MKCKICNKKMSFNPPLNQRNRNINELKAIFYAHSDCIIEKRNNDVKALMKKIREENAKKKVFIKGYKS